MREIKHRVFNYGAPLSLREAASDKHFYRYFQKIDVEMFNKMVTRRVLDSLIEFLDEHDIDTSDLRQQNISIYVGPTFADNATFIDSAVAFGRNAVARFTQGPGTLGGNSAQGGKK